MPKTTNIPEKLPISVCPADEEAIVKWISEQEAHEWDDTAHSRSRWAFTVVDYGVLFEITVKDAATGNTFEVPVNIDEI